MGLVATNIILPNPVLPEHLPASANCLVDSAATCFCMTQPLANQSGSRELRQNEAQMADGPSRIASYIGRIKVVLENRACIAGAFVSGNEHLLGPIPMIDMDLVVIPGLSQRSVNPESPNIARK